MARFLEHWQHVEEPITNVEIVRHTDIPKEAIYTFVKWNGPVSFQSYMASAPITNNFFPRTNAEPVDERAMEAEDLIYLACDQDTIPTNPRAREAWGFNICQSEQQAMCLLEAYGKVMDEGLHQRVLGSWRTKAILEARVGAIIRATASTEGLPSTQAHNPLQALPILRALDRDMQSKSLHWRRHRFMSNARH